MLRIFILCLLVINSALAKDLELGAGVQGLYVIDGDSVNLKMRLAGIDAPEIGQLCQKTIAKRIDCGRFSAEQFQLLLNQTPGELRIQIVGMDKYQRLLVKIYKGDVNIGQLMVEQGLAFSYRDTYLSEQHQAQANNLGFWAFESPPIKPYQWRRLHRP